jgi:membrane-bound metal-dependent hydrolase YbcI (DUF457 family)
MPSPYAHFLAATALASPYLAKGKLDREKIEKAATLLVFSILPDLDAVPGILMGDLPAYHNQISHSIGFGFSICLLYALLRQCLPKAAPFLHLFSLACAAYGLHLFMDWLTWGRGVMLFWPLSSHRFSPPVHLFYGLRHSEGLLSRQHGITFATESFTMIPLLLTGWWFINKRRVKSTK